MGIARRTTSDQSAFDGDPSDLRLVTRDNVHVVVVVVLVDNIEQIYAINKKENKQTNDDYVAAIHLTKRPKNYYLHGKMTQME